MEAGTLSYFSTLWLNLTGFAVTTSSFVTVSVHCVVVAKPVRFRLYCCLQHNTAYIWRAVITLMVILSKSGNGCTPAHLFFSQAISIDSQSLQVTELAHPFPLLLLPSLDGLNCSWLSRARPALRCPSHRSDRRAASLT